MFKIFDEKINGFLFVIILPLLLFAMSYYGFESSYTRLKTSDRPPSFLFTSVYSYRVIPNYLSVQMTDLMEYLINNHLSGFRDFLSKNGTPFYHGLFLMNSFFLVICSLVINTILKFKTVDFLLNINVRRIIHLLCVFFIVITQYAPTNCDTIALCCYLIGVLLTLKYIHTNKNGYYFILIVLIALSTLVRETACINIAFFAAVLFSVKELKEGNYQFIWKVIPLVIAFLVPYLGLRAVMNHEHTTFVEGIYISKNFSSPFNLAGLLFAVIVLYFIYKLCVNEESRTVFKKYLFFSLPYLAMITLVGLFWEVRLFLPLILTGIIMASHQFKNTKQ
ncbi:Dolichyl-phosphate-mannose-protein mannosyltransferase [Chryseobacterium wanjuense]|uniref:Dolichyl-phosphate-mannose-protein mannosyltransferase n=1 Tax=Chryseobacterium wanjuense TaxID=356305 RepID=A0A1I0RW99_9FLAO|nr:glycosyltransferase family 39 protein [Chryseobacterium wanjuense]SEW45802.1 Dolichyl-phosphate-mannose-protein mannosyltransferase [Chryseobacterium wanjuense]